MARQAAKYRAAKKHSLRCYECDKPQTLAVLPGNGIYTCESCRYFGAYNV